MPTIIAGGTAGQPADTMTVINDMKTFVTSMAVKIASCPRELSIV
jgi:hypothetical protein